jgi:hypothetical protein
VLYASDLLGAYETCGCPVHPMGGLARRATQVDRARADSDGALVLDAGDDLLPAPGRPADAGELERRARLVLRAMGRIGTTAFTPGERDLALGVPVLRRLAAEARVPIVSANLRDRTGKPLFPPDRLIDAAGLRIGVFGVTAPPTTADAAALRAAGIDAGDPAAVARDEVAALRARGAAMVIALVHVGAPADTRRLLGAVPDIDWAVGGHSGLRLESPEAIGGARLLGVLPEGKELGRLDLHAVEGGATFADRGERAELETILADHRRQLVDYDRRLGETDPASLRDYYETRRHALEAAIARETALLERLPRTITGSWFENRLIPLDAETPDQTGVALLVAAYNQESARRAAAGKPVGVGNPTEERPRPSEQATPPATAAASTFAGTPACGGCHAPALAFWRTTKHARALAALERVGRARDPACVGCHVTGYLQPGGFTLIGNAADAQRPALANVGCEACHGPGQAHVLATDKKGSATAAVPTATCLGCHTPDVTGGDFDQRAFRNAILGPGHGRASAPLAPAPHPSL